MGVILADSADAYFTSGTELDNFLADTASEGRVAHTRLRTSDRVIARVTDGIYREPASALRELISNAWDADANTVTIQTDAPRFTRMTVKDDGRGMSHSTLTRLLYNIGGSAKRTESGKDLGITSPDDATLTPGGRPIIGKIGIGLFSVSQLARRFTIITKSAGETYRLVAEIQLRQFSEDQDEDSTDASDDYLTGDVYITREPSADIEAHGTDIVLNDIKPRVRDMLRSNERWTNLFDKEKAKADGDTDLAAAINAVEPKFHTGWIGSSISSNVYAREPLLPWHNDTPSAERMKLLIDGIEAEAANVETPNLENTLDTYLATLWNLALSAPVGYIGKHPFELTKADNLRAFWLSNEPKGQAIELDLSAGLTVRDAVKSQIPDSPELLDGSTLPAGKFAVIVDGVELKRPIRFRYLKQGEAGPGLPLLFVGKYCPDLRKIPARLTGGELSFESYLYWNGKVIPKENNGVLVRIKGSSSGEFDSTFFNYQISEQTRLRQIVSEIFASKGLDAALNIDRESFNYSHPHAQLISSWMHNAVRQLTNRHKAISKIAADAKKEQKSQLQLGKLATHADNVWRARQGDEPPPQIWLESTKLLAQAARTEGGIAISRDQLPALSIPAKTPQEASNRDEKAKALVSVLMAFDVLRDRSYSEQQDLIDSILQIFFGTD